MGWVIQAGRRFYGSLMTLKTIEKLFCHDPFRSSHSFISSPICHTFESRAFASHRLQMLPRQPQVTLFCFSKTCLGFHPLFTNTKNRWSWFTRNIDWPGASQTGAHMIHQHGSLPGHTLHIQAPMYSRAVCIHKYPPLQLSSTTNWLDLGCNSSLLTVDRRLLWRWISYLGSNQLPWFS